MPMGYFNRTWISQTGLEFSARGLFINRAAMDRARFMFCTGFIIIFF